MSGRVSVVICAYAGERWESLVAAVRSALRQTLAPLEVVVVVDHNPALLARARQALGAIATVTENAHARGLSGSRNSGIAASEGEVVAFLDDDAVAEPEWLERLVAPYRDGRVAGVGGAIEPRWLAGRPAGFPAEFAWVVGCTYTGVPTAPSPVRNLIGANMSFRRDIFEKVGGFRTGFGRVGRFPAGCEETELCIRARQRLPEAVFLFDPRARVVHEVPAARTTWAYFGSRCLAEGQSKAQVSSSTGARDGLASERAYVRRTLPAGALRGLADALRGDASGLLRSTAIVGGLGVTTLGYVLGTLRLARAPRRRVARAPGREPGPSGAACAADPADPADTPDAPRRFSVVVPTCGDVDALAACVDSICAGDHPHLELVVVDNAPHRSQTAAFVARRARSDARIRRIAELRPGAAVARAAGLAAAREPFVAFVDDDVVVDRRWLSAIADAFSAAPGVEAVTTLIAPQALDTPAQRWLEQYGGYGKGDRRQLFDLTEHRLDDPLYPYAPGRYGSGASMAFRTRTLRDLGGFDTRLSTGGEDLDLFLKVVLGGHRLVYEPAAIAWHRHPASRTALRRTMFRYGAGLTAVMTKWLLSDPRTARDIVRRLPGALRLALDPGSRKNAGKLPGYPRELTWLERGGMLAGPVAYALACWRARRHRGDR